MGREQFAERRQGRFFEPGPGGFGHIAAYLGRSGTDA